MDRLAWCAEQVVQRGDCLEWIGQLHGEGYGMFRWQVAGTRHRVYAHRFIYEAVIGPIPAGMDIDHLCRNRACQNVLHMEPVPRGVNVLRGQGWAGLNARKTHCPRGHEYTPDNIIHMKFGRWCRTCRRQYERDRRLRKRAA